MLKAGNLWYLTGDMHLHTHHSDGEQLEKMISQVVNCGFDFCAVTDHDTYSGSRAALALAAEAGEDFPIIISGQEATCSGCHILAYGTLEPFSKTGTLPDVCRSIRSAGGFAVAAHPDWEFTRESFRTNGLFAHLVENALLDGVELMNFPLNECRNIEKEWTNSYTLEKFGREEFFSLTAGSDAHRAGEITSARFVGVFAETCDEKGILDAIFKKRLSVAVWNGCAIGTPEALRLFRELGKAAFPSMTPEFFLSREIRKNGVIYHIGNNFSSGVSFCGRLEKTGSKTLFHYGHTKDHDLILGKNGNSRAAFCAETADGVELKSVPALTEDGGITPVFSFEKPDFLTNEEINFSGTVNGRSFNISDSAGNFALPEHPLAYGKNLLSLICTTCDGVPLGEKTWDYPIAQSGVWQSLELPVIQADAPDGKEVRARFRFTAPKERVTLEMEIEDRFFFQPYRGFAMYMGDSIQFGIDPECSASLNDLVDRKIWELGIAMTNSGCELVVYNHPENRDGDIFRWEFSGRREGEKQFYTVAIPQEILPPGRIFGFNMIYNINDGSGRRGYLAWRNGIGDRKRSADWGFVI